MNKKLFIAASVLAVSGMLAACGSDEKSTGSTQGTTNEAETQVNETTITEETGQEASIEENTNQDTSSTEASGEPVEENPVISEGTLTVSDSQSYEIYLLPGYELIAEEPNKDVIHSSQNDELFMRVETFTPDEADFNFIHESIQETLKASNENAELVELPAFEEPEFNNSALYEVPTETGKHTGVVFEKDNVIVKLTIFDLNNDGSTDDFINMGKTISVN